MSSLRVRERGVAIGAILVIISLIAAVSFVVIKEGAKTQSTSSTKASLAVSTHESDFRKFKDALDLAVARGADLNSYFTNPVFPERATLDDFAPVFQLAGNPGLQYLAPSQDFNDRYVFYRCDLNGNGIDDIMLRIDYMNSGAPGEAQEMSEKFEKLITRYPLRYNPSGWRYPHVGGTALDSGSDYETYGDELLDVRAWGEYLGFAMSWYYILKVY